MNFKFDTPGNSQILLKKEIDYDKVIKYLPKKIIVQLYYLYSACLKLQYFPKQWKQAKIIIPKPKKDLFKPENYLRFIDPVCYLLLLSIHSLSVNK